MLRKKRHKVTQTASSSCHLATQQAPSERPKDKIALWHGICIFLVMNKAIDILLGAIVITGCVGFVVGMVYIIGSLWSQL
jgi:hypothetical protein